MGHIDPTKEVFAQFRANDRPGPIHMLNLVRLRATGGLSRRPQGDRRGGLCGLWPRERTGVRTARRPDRLAGAVRTDADRARRTERWDHCFIAEYPSVAAFVEMIRDPVYREAVKHRQAAVEDSRLIRHAVLPVGKTFGEIPK